MEQKSATKCKTGSNPDSRPAAKSPQAAGHAKPQYKLLRTNNRER